MFNLLDLPLTLLEVCLKYSLQPSEGRKGQVAVAHFCAEA